MTPRAEFVLAFLACAVVLAFVGTTFARGAAANHRAPSLRDSPGWYPVVDPESASVELGRRTHAPLVRRPFAGGAPSLAGLGRAICRGLAYSDRDSLEALCIRADEFRDILWREFPQSRPATGLKWEDGWLSLEQRLRSGVSGALGDYGGHAWTFEGFRCESVATYKNFRLHMGLTLMATDEQGRTVPMAWVRTIAERRGRFKIYSTDD